MTKSQMLRRLLGATILCFPASAAVAETQSFIDLQAGVGYSTNPLLVSGDETGSAFGRISAYGFHGWSSERSSTSLSAYVENSTYFRRYSNKQLFNINANTRREVSETVRLYANLGFSADFGAQLSSRFYGIPAGSVVPDPGPPDNTVIVVDPDLSALNQRQYRLSGQVGANFTLSPKDSLTTSFGAQRVFFSGSSDFLNYNQYDGAIGYQRQINERLSVGARLIANYADYALGRSVMSIGPQATVNARLSEDWDASAALGFVRTKQDFGELGGSDSSIDLALDGSLCRSLEFERMCARVSRRTQSSVLGVAPTSTSISADYFRKLSAKDQIQASAGVVRTGGAESFGISQRQTFYTLAGSYDRMINDRFSAGANLAARKLSSFGPDPRVDFGGSIFVRYRLGDLR